MDGRPHGQSEGPTLVLSRDSQLKKFELNNNVATRRFVGSFFGLARSYLLFGKLHGPSLIGSFIFAVVGCFGHDLSDKRPI